MCTGVKLTEYQMKADEKKDYLLGLITARNLVTKDIRSLEDEAAKWKGRAELARSGGAPDLLGEAERELEEIERRLAGLKEEEQSYKGEIEALQRRSTEPSVFGNAAPEELKAKMKGETF